MAKRVIWSNSAKISRWNILEYWIKKTGSKKYSRKLAQEFNDRVDKIKSFPEIGKPTEIEEIRTTASGHFSIFYRIYEDFILIVGIYDTRRDPEEIVKKILKNGR